MNQDTSEGSPSQDRPALPELITYAPVVSSIDLHWKGLIVERYRRPPDALSVPPLSDHWLTCYLGSPTRLIQRRNGQLHHGGLSQGDITLTAAGSSSSWEWDTFSDNLHIGLTSELLHTVARDIGCPNPNAVELRDAFHLRDEHVQTLAQLLLQEVEHPQIGSRLSAEALSLTLAVHLLRTSARFSPPKAPPTLLSRADLRHATDYIKAHLASDLSLAEISAAVSLSPHHFSRCFKQTTGQSLHQYVIAERIAFARSLLQREELSLAEIAALSGFYDQSHLTAHFRRMLGVTPSKFRAQNRKNFP